MADLARFDVLIVGGGPIGGLLATVLGLAGLAVAVVDASEPEPLARSDSDARALAVAAGPQRLIQTAGAWDAMAPQAGAILEIRVTDDASPLFLHYDHREIGDAPLGWVVPNPTIRAAVTARMATLESVRLFAPARIRRLERLASRVEAELEDGTRLAASLAVAADGRRSATRQAAGITTTGRDYGADGIVCVIEHAEPHHGIAHERFLPGGPFALLPLAENRSGVVWTEPRTLAVAICRQSPEDFRAELAAKIGGFLGDIRLAGPWFHHPLTLHSASDIIAPRLALVGDAAHGMHPIAGQGLNLGLRDVAALAEAIADARRLGLDPGSPPVLERYARWRRFDTLLMLGVTDALDRLFSNAVPPLRLARRLGLAAVNHLPPAKRLFMRHAMGVAGDLPRLMKGEPL